MTENLVKSLLLSFFFLTLFFESSESVSHSVVSDSL